MAGSNRVEVVVLAPEGAREGAWAGEEAAVKAARDAVRALAEAGFEGRAGVHTGRAGARALAEAAPPGAVWISKAVERQIPRRFRFHEMPVIEAGGEALPPYEVVEEIGPPGEFGEAVPVPDAETWAAEVRPGARIAFVGPPGSGRSTLLRAVRDRVRAVSPEAWVACGRCERRPPAPWGAPGDILRAEAAASGHDRWDGERVVAAVKRLGGGAAEADAIALSLGLRLNADGDPPPPGPEVARAAWIAALGRATLLCVEDLEDAQPEERDALAACGAAVFATAAPGTPLPPGFRAVERAPAPRPVAPAPPELRELLGAAAVLGRSCWRFTLERILLRDSTEELAAARGGGWLLERRGSLMRGDGELLFPHRGMRDRAEAALTAEERRGFHAAAAAFYGQRAAVAGPAAAARAAWHRGQAG